MGLNPGLSGVYLGDVGLNAGLDPPPKPGDAGEWLGLKEPENGLATGENALPPNGVLIPGLAPGLNLDKIVTLRNDEGLLYKLTLSISYSIKSAFLGSHPGVKC